MLAQREFARCLDKTSSVMTHPYTDKRLMWLQVLVASRTLPAPGRLALHKSLLMPALLLDSLSPMGIHPTVEVLLMSWQSCP